MNEDASLNLNDAGKSVDDVSGATETRANAAKPEVEPKVEPELMPSATGDAAALSAKSVAWAATLLGMPGGAVDPHTPLVPSAGEDLQPTVPTDVGAAVEKAGQSSSAEGSRAAPAASEAAESLTKAEGKQSRPPVVFHESSDDDDEDELGPAIGEGMVSRAFARSLGLGTGAALVMGLAVVGLIRIGPQDNLEIQPTMTSTSEAPAAPAAVAPGSPPVGAVVGSSSEAVTPAGDTPAAPAERGLTAGAPPEGLSPAAVTGDSPASEPWPVRDDPAADQRASEGRMADKPVRAVGANGPTSLGEATAASSKAPLSPSTSLRSVARAPEDRTGDPKMERALAGRSAPAPDATYDGRANALPADGRLSAARKPGETPVGGPPPPARVAPARLPDPGPNGRRDIVPAGGPTQPNLSVRPAPAGPSPRPATSLSEDPDAPLPLTEP